MSTARATAPRAPTLVPTLVPTRVPTRVRHQTRAWARVRQRPHQRPSFRRPAGPHPVAAAAGFTLVEVLVALVIMAVIASMGWQGVDSMLRTREISAGAAERSLRLQHVVGQWEADLAQLLDTPVAPALAFDGQSLRLVRRQAEGAQVVVWALHEGRWLRWASAVVQQQDALQQAWLAALQLQGREAGQLRMLPAQDDAPGLSSWNVQFSRGGFWTNAQSSGDVDPAALQAPALQGTTSGAPGATQAPGTSTGGVADGGSAAQPARASPPRSSGLPQAGGLPDGVRLMLDLPEGRLTRDVLIRP